jgi:hypothetical protein
MRTAALLPLVCFHLVQGVRAVSLLDSLFPDLPPVGAPRAEPLLRHLAHPPAGRRPHPRLDPRDLAPARPSPFARRRSDRLASAGRRLLQNECDQNMTLVGSQCVCASGFYDSASAPQLFINGVDSVCLGADTATDLADACELFVDPLGTPGVCGVIAGASDGLPAYTAVDYTLNGGPRILPHTPGAPAWLLVDLEVPRTVGGVSFKQWLSCPAGSACAGAFRGFQLYVGNNPTAYDAEGNTLCFTNADNARLNALNSGGTLSSGCLGIGRYVFVVAPPNANPGEYTVMPIWHLQVFPPGACNPITPCVQCPAGHISVAGSNSADDCYIETGIFVNSTINFVDVGLNQSEFSDALPDYMRLISFSEDPEAFFENCPAGYYCLTDSTIPRACPAGTYRDTPGAELVGDCHPCPPGDYCPVASPFSTACPPGTYRGTQGAGEPRDCTNCLSGNYCPMGSVNPTNCTPGTYRATVGGATSADCLACPPGRFCGLATTTPTECPAGTFNDNPGGITANDCLQCLPGRFCPAGAVTPTSCPAGTYMSAYGAPALASCVACPAGRYCPEASVEPTECPAGNFRPTTGGQSDADCTTCPAGSFCPAGASSPTQCPAGTYLSTTGGAQRGNCVSCDEGNYCVAGSIGPALCPAGTYRDIAGAGSVGQCFSCPSGQYCGEGTVSPTSCLPGTYRATVGATTVADCLPCPPGQYCPFATTTPLNCPAGTYLTTTGGVDRASCVLCPSGNYCPETSPTPTVCPAGTYRTATGGRSLSDCLACPAGQYCPQETTTPTSCPAGTYNGEANATASAACLPCPAGQYCLERTVTPADCNAGTYRGTTGATQQADCAACPTGNYCPQQSVDPTNCTAGTFRTGFSGRSAGDCAACPAGFYCPLANTNPLRCLAGTFRTSTGAQRLTDCTACPAGAYCPAGSVRPTLCSAGFHRDTPRATHLANCLLCLPGTYSLDVGRTSNCPICAADFYCRTSTLKQACPTNTKAPAGSYSILNCACNPGFQCTYYKQIQAIVTLNTTLYDFNNNVGEIQAAFLQAMAAAANVSSSQVVINGVVDAPTPPSGSRRLLGAHLDSLTVTERFALLDAAPADADEAADGDDADEPDAPVLSEERVISTRHLLAAAGPSPQRAPRRPRNPGGIQVLATVNGSGRLHRLEHHLARHDPTLHISHRWEQSHKVHARRALA